MKNIISLLIIFMIIPFSISVSEADEVVYGDNYAISSPKKDSCGKRVSIDNYHVKNNILLNIKFKIEFVEPLTRENCACKGPSQQLLIEIYGKKLKSTTKVTMLTNDYSDKNVKINKSFNATDKLAIYYWCNVH